MHPKQLIGKKAIRTAPVSYGKRTPMFGIGGAEENLDYSFTSEPLVILAVTDSHIVYEYPNYCSYLKGNHFLDSRWIDNNWADYQALMDKADEAVIEIHKVS
jgi:hypothetical protein